MQISELTYKIVSFQDIQKIDTDECVDWAVEMIELGYESPTLNMLSSFTKPTNYFEVIGYLTKTIKELGLQLKSGDDAILSYISYYIHQIAKEIRVRENLSLIYEFCQFRDYEELVYDFYLLFWAWDHLDYEDNEYNHYWNGARRENIEQIVIDEAKKWIEKNEKYYAQNTIYNS